MSDTAERRPLLNAADLARQLRLVSPSPSFPSAADAAKPQRPKLERPPSRMRYSSLPFTCPPTPEEERLANQQSFIGALLWPRKHEELSYPDVTYDPESGLPRLTRSCVASEARCYGKWIIPTLLVFGLIAILFAFYFARNWRL